MKVKEVKDGKVTDEELNLYKQRASKLDAPVYTALDVEMDKRIVTVNVHEELTFINPKIEEYSKDVVIYIENDGRKNRRTKRSNRVVVVSDNLKPMEFSADLSNWKTDDYDFLQDIGLFECVLIQRAIDAINGIDINHPSIKYNIQVVNKEDFNRNEKFMIQSEDGDMQYIKYKKSKTTFGQRTI